MNKIKATLQYLGSPLATWHKRPQSQIHHHNVTKWTPLPQQQCLDYNRTTPLSGSTSENISISLSYYVF